MMEDFDPFAPGSNIKENFDGTLKCVFEKSENSDNYNAHMFIRATDGEEVETFLSLGRDWVSYDGGKSVEHPRGEATKFNAQTTYSEWITFAMGGFDGEKGDPDARPAELGRGLGAARILRDRNRELGNRGPQVASIWDGLSFHFDVVKRHGRQRSVTKTPDGEKVEWLDVIVDRMMPTRFLGAQGTLEMGGVANTLGGSSTKSTTAPSNPVAADAQGGGIHPALADLDERDRTALVTLAKNKDFGDFVDGVMALGTANGGSMLEVPKVIQALSDEGFYQSLRKG
jgi:hypothetical protein